MQTTLGGDLNSRAMDCEWIVLLWAKGKWSAKRTKAFCRKQHIHIDLRTGIGNEVEGFDMISGEPVRIML